MKIFIHTNQTLSALFSQYLKNPESFRPLLIEGDYGVGKFEYIKCLIKSFSSCSMSIFENFKDTDISCKCVQCQKIDQNKHTDILVLDGSEKIEDFRNSVIEFVRNIPYELNHRFLIVRNSHLYTTKHMEFLLKTLEEPPKYLMCFLTTTNLEFNPPAINSRCHTIKTPILSQESIESILDGDKKLTPLLKVHKKIPEAKSISEIEIYNRYEFLKHSEDFFNKRYSPIELNGLIEKFLSLIATDIQYPINHILNSFLEYSIPQIKKVQGKDVKKQFKEKIYLNQIDSILNQFSESLFRYIQKPNYSYYMNLKDMFFQFVLSINICKKVIDV